MRLCSAFIPLFSLQALFDLEATSTELKADLKDLYITAAKEVDVGQGRKAIIIHVSLSHCGLSLSGGLLVKEPGRPPAGGSKQVAAASQTSIGVQLLLPLFIRSSSRQTPLTRPAGSNV